MTKGRSSFGRSRDVAWSQPKCADDEVSVVAARLQHQIVLRCRDRLSGQGMTVASLADLLDAQVPSVGTRAEMLRRKFRGESPASVPDLVAWLTVLGIRDHPMLGRVAAEEADVSVTGDSYAGSSDSTETRPSKARREG